MIRCGLCMHVVAALLALSLPAPSFSQTDTFSADSVYAYIEHLAVDIGPRPMGSLNERLALDWVVNKFHSFGADSVYIMHMTKVPSQRSPSNTNSGVAVGMFRGETDSTIVIGGHIDSAGREIPGANDNASGAATTIELARIWSQRERHYTMVFATFGGEERGLFGSKHFVKHYHNIDNASLMLCIDMTAADDRIVTISETDASQAPVWLMKDAFALDRVLGINRLQYPTHFASLNNLMDGAGSDHMPFLDAKIPAIDFTAGVNSSPIHTPQDNIAFVSMDMLDRCGRLVDGLLQKYQEQGIPTSNGGRFMLWRVFGTFLFIPTWLIVVIDVGAGLLGIAAFLHSRRNRLRIKRRQRIRFSGLKLALMLIIIVIFMQFGEAILQFLKGLRYPWLVHLCKYLWYAAIWAIAGMWVVLQLTRTWRFSPDLYVYAKRALVILFIFAIPMAVASTRLALYPAITLALFSLAILIPIPVVRLTLCLVALLPMCRLMFSEGFLLFFRRSIEFGFSIDTFWKALLYSTIITLLVVIWYLPFIYLWSYAVVSVKPAKWVTKLIRTPAFGVIILAALIGYGGFLYSLPSYNEMWRPAVRVNAEYKIQKQESTLQIVGNEFFKNVHVTTEVLDTLYNGRFHKVELPDSFVADWLNVAGIESVTSGEKDTVAIDWQITSSRPWYVTTLSVSVDTLEIDTVASDLEFLHKKDRVIFSWFAEPPETLDVVANLVVHAGAKLIRRVTGHYAEMPIPITVTAELANVRYRTTVVWEDTLRLDGQQLDLQ